MAEDDGPCVVTLTVNLQGMSVDRRAFGEDPSEHYGKKAHGRYMAAVGAGRLFDLFDELGLRSTVFVPGSEAEEHPALVQEIAQRGHEIAAHGYAHEDYGGAASDEALLRRTHSILTDLCGAAPRGWRAPTGLLTPETLAALSRLGYAYDSSNQDDDFPYRLDADQGVGMIELPQQEMLIDDRLYGQRATHQQVLAWWREEFAALHEERCYIMITVSPRADYGSGRASRIQILKAFLTEVKALPRVEVGPCQAALASISDGRLYCRD